MIFSDIFGCVQYVNVPQPRPLTDSTLASWIALDLAERIDKLQRRGDGFIYCLPSQQRILVTLCGDSVLTVKNEIPLGAVAALMRTTAQHSPEEVACRLTKVVANARLALASSQCQNDTNLEIL